LLERAEVMQKVTLPARFSTLGGRPALITGFEINLRASRVSQNLSARRPELANESAS